MDFWIEALDEPERLILSWRAPEGVEDRRRWAVGELASRLGSTCFRYFSGEEFQSMNGGRQPELLKSQGYAGYPAFDERRSVRGVFEDGVIEAFLRRLPPASRADFGAYLAHFCLRSAANLGPLALLAATEARLPGDGFSLIDPLDPEAQARDLVIEVAGHRHHAGGRDCLRLGASLDLVPEPEHPQDRHAVRIEQDGVLLGYVNRLQASAVGRWLETRDVEAFLLRLNGSPQSPRAFAFIRMRPVAQRRAA